MNRVVRTDFDQWRKFAANADRLVAYRLWPNSTIKQIDIFDLGMPAHPVRLGDIPDGRGIGDLVIHDDVVWTTVPGGSVMGHDLRSIGSPPVTITIPGSDQATAVACTGDRLLVAASESGLHVFNAARSARPTFASPPPRVAHMPTLGTPREVAVAGSLVIGVLGDQGVAFVSFADPTSPRLMSIIDTPGFADDVAVTGSTVLVADGTGGVRLFDISNPASPRAASPSSLNVARATAVEIRAGTTLAYVIDAATDRIRVFDFINPAVVRELGAVQVDDDSWVRLRNLEDVCFDGEFIYTLSRGLMAEWRLTIDLIAARPRIEQVWPPMPADAPRGRLAAADHSVYAVYPTTGSAVHFDAVEPTNYSSTCHGSDVAALHTHAFVLNAAVFQSGFYYGALSVQRHQAWDPVEIGRVGIGPSPHAHSIGGMCLSPAGLYFGHASRGLGLFDLPGRPRVVVHPQDAHLCPEDLLPLVAEGQADPGIAVRKYWRLESYNQHPQYFNFDTADFIGPRRYQCVISAGCGAVVTRAATITAEAVSDLLPDGGFEYPVAPPYPQASRRVGLADGVAPRSGAACLLLGDDGLAVRAIDAVQMRPFGFGPHASGPLTVWAKSTTTAPSYFRIDVRYFNSPNTEFLVTLTPDWTQYEVPISRIDDLDFIDIYSFPPDSAAIDDVSIPVPILSGYQPHVEFNSGCPGHSVRIRLPIADLPSHPLTFQWQHNGQPLMDGPNIQGAASPTLIIRAHDSSTVGEYFCHVTNSCDTQQYFWSVSCHVGPGLDLFSFLDAFFRGDPFGGDHNRSGRVSVEDLFAFLQDYFAGCI